MLHLRSDPLLTLRVSIQADAKLKLNALQCAVASYKPAAQAKRL